MRDRLSQKQLILQLLRAHACVTNAVLKLVTHRYAARIYELRKDGYKIDRKRINRRLFKYWINNAQR